MAVVTVVAMAVTVVMVVAMVTMVLVATVVVWQRETVMAATVAGVNHRDAEGTDERAGVGGANADKSPADDGTAAAAFRMSNMLDGAEDG